MVALLAEPLEVALDAAGNHVEVEPAVAELVERRGHLGEQPGRDEARSVPRGAPSPSIGMNQSKRGSGRCAGLFRSSASAITTATKLRRGCVRRNVGAGETIAPPGARPAGLEASALQEQTQARQQQH